MSRSPRGQIRSIRPALLVATMLTAALALGGCSAGTVTQTDTQVSGAAGATGQTGQMLVRDLSLDPGPEEVVPAGSQVAVRGTLINESPTPDRLVSVSTPYARSVQVEGSTVVPGGDDLRIVGAEPGPVGPSAPGTSLVTAGTSRIVLRGVTQVLRPGPTYAVTFTFERAGTVTVPTIVVGTGPSAG